MSKERRHLFRKIPLIQICFDTLQMESSHWSVALQYKQIRIPHKDLQLHSLSYKILPHADSVLLYVTILQDEGKTLYCIVLCVYIEVKWGFLFKIGSPWTPRCFRPTRQSWRFWREGKGCFFFFNVLNITRGLQIQIIKHSLVFVISHLRVFQVVLVFLVLMACQDLLELSWCCL